MLVDSRAAITGCIRHALTETGHAVPPTEALLACIGPPLAVAFAGLLGDEVASPAVAACVAAYRERYATASLVETTVVPGVPAALDALAAEHALAVATSKPLAFTEPLLAALDLRARFAVVAGPDLAARAEDKAATIAAALAALGSVHAVMVGDRSFDVVGARAHGLATIGVTWGIGSRAELEGAGAAALVDTPAALPDAVAALLAG